MSTWNATPVPGLVSKPQAEPMASRILRLSCSSTRNRMMSRWPATVSPRNVLAGFSPSPRALVMTVQPVAPCARAAAVAEGLSEVAECLVAPLDFDLLARDFGVFPWSFIPLRRKRTTSSELTT